MSMFDIIGYSALEKHPDVVTGVILQDRENPSVKVKTSIDTARDLFHKHQINTSKKETTRHR